MASKLKEGLLMKVLVFYGSVRRHRRGIRAARFVVNEMEKRGHEVSLIDAKEYDFGLLDLMYKEYRSHEKPPKMKALADLIEGADGFIVVSGEYNHSIPPALSNMMDHYLEEYFFRPAGIVAYSAGRFSGARVAMQLRAFLAEMGMPTISSLFLISKVQETFDEEGVPVKEGYEKHFVTFAEELEWYMKTLKDGNANYKRPY